MHPTNTTVYFPITNKYPYKRKWDLSLIWEKSKYFTVQKIKVSELWNTRYSKAWCWQHENETINNEFFLHHLERVMSADLNYPIILSEENLIFDGVHRLMKAKYLGMQYINYVKFSKDPLPICSEMK
jgi:disulfide oxidoreductase YuzD